MIASRISARFLSLVLISVVLVLLQGCASPRFHTGPVVTNDEQRIVYEQTGLPLLVQQENKKDILVVALDKKFNSKNRNAILVRVLNQTDHPIHFAPQNIQFSCLVNGDETQCIPLKTMTAEQYFRKVRGQRKWERFMMNMNNASRLNEADRAGRTVTTGTFNAQQRGGGDVRMNGSPLPRTLSYDYRGSVHGTYVQESYNPYIAQLARREAEAINAQERERFARESAEIEQKMLLDTFQEVDLPPDSTVAGFVYFVAPKLKKGHHILKVVCPFDEKQYSFYFDLSSRKLVTHSGTNPQEGALARPVSHQKIEPITRRPSQPGSAKTLPTDLTSQINKYEMLRQIQQLYKSGAITKKEFEQEKRKVLNN